MRSSWIAILAVIAGLLGVAAGTLPFVPASYLARQVEAATHGGLILAEPQGTIWHGSARPAFASGGQLEAARVAVLPGHVEWNVEDLGIAPPRFVLGVGGDGMIGKPFRIAVTTDAVRIEPGNIRLPADILESAGAPLNTVRPGGAVSISWDTLSLRSGAADVGLDGALTVEWNDARSAISPVVPLGSYRLTARGAGAQVGLELTTVKGPLLLSGNGQWMLQRGVQFRGEAQAEPARQAELAPLIGLLGRRSGNGAELRFGS